MTHHRLDLETVREASERIADRVHRTPVVRCETLDRLAGRKLFFKCENFQKVGAFKFRGACNAVQKLPPELARRGVVTHSSGNHAQALALAARLRGIEAHIILPTDSPGVKRRAVEGYGARVIDCEPSLDAREREAARILTETGASFIHPYDDAARSLAAGERIPQLAPDTIADGLLTSLGELNWPILRDHLERVVTVEDSEIVVSMRLLFMRAKLVVEASAAVALAAVLSGEFKSLSGVERVGVILSGGNVDLDALPWS